MSPATDEIGPHDWRAGHEPEPKGTDPVTETYAHTCTELAARVASLEAERDELRKALRDIRLYAECEAGSPTEPIYNIARAARAALAKADK